MILSFFFKQNHIAGVEIMSPLSSGRARQALARAGMANYGPGTICNSLSSLIWPAELAEMILLINKS